MCTCKGTFAVRAEVRKEKLMGAYYCLGAEHDPSLWPTAYQPTALCIRLIIWLGINNKI